MAPGSEFSDIRATAAAEPDVLSDRDMLVAAEQRASYLADISAALTGSLNLRRTVLKLLHVAQPALADWVMLVVPDPASGRVGVYGGESPAFHAFTSVPSALTVGLGKVLRTGQTELLHVALDPDPADEHSALAAMVPVDELRVQASRLRPADVLGVGLAARGGIVGALVLIRGARRGFETEDVRLAEQVAGRAAVALDSARLYEERAHVASVLQASLRPPEPPVIPGLRVAARFRAAAEHLDIGGDFYDVHGSDGDWLVVVGDVCGKGVEAAVLTGRARQSIRTAAQFDRRPSAILAALNAVLYEADADRFVTAVCLRLRPRPDGSTHVDLAVAGHPPPIVVRASGSTEQPEVAGMLAGVLADVTYRDATLRLHPGDTVLMFTDGVYEARNSGGFYGMERLLGLVPAYAGSGPEALCEAVEQDVVEYLDGGAHDDIALVAVGLPKDGT